MFLFLCILLKAPFGFDELCFPIDVCTVVEDVASSSQSEDVVCSPVGGCLDGACKEGLLVFVIDLSSTAREGQCHFPLFGSMVLGLVPKMCGGMLVQGIVMYAYFSGEDIVTRIGLYGATVAEMVPSSSC